MAGRESAGRDGSRRRDQGGPTPENARLRPKLYKAGRLKGTREIVVRPNYVMVYRVTGDVVEVLRVLHAAQQWP